MAMVIKDLRHKNVVEGVDGRVAMVLWVKHRKAFLHYMGDILKAGEDTWDLKGVAASDWWLEYMGFKEVGSGLWRKTWAEKGGARVEIRGGSGGVWLYAMDANGGGNLVKASRKLEFVHEIQNVWWSITGEDMEFKQSFKGSIEDFAIKAENL